MARSRGLLLVNLGTPADPSPRSVRRYLRQFLSDPRVLDMNPLSRALLLHLVILPRRPRRSAAAYRLIWTERGSPLLFHSQDLVASVRARLDGDPDRDRLGPWRVELGMRYGEPSIASALERLRAAGAGPLTVLPLFPQYSSAATGSAIEEVFRVIGARQAIDGLAIREDFHEEPGFVDAFAAIGRPLWERERASDPGAHLLLSFHGLPERQIRRCDSTGAHCLERADCCDAVAEVNRHCYRAQCHATARVIAGRLGAAATDHTVSFQSRLGRTPWIKPYTDHVLPELAARGIKRLVVYCPAFVADCLETLEEIGLRARAQWKGLGGEELTLVPSLNSTPAWADAVAAMARGLSAGPPLQEGVGVSRR